MADTTHPQPTTPSVPAYALAEELHRRTLRLTELAEAPDAPEATISEVRGEVIGLRGAIGIVLGGSVPGGTADRLGHDYYQDWLKGNTAVVRQGATA